MLAEVFVQNVQLDEAVAQNTAIPVPVEFLVKEK